jgi:hypothetical protein
MRLLYFSPVFADSYAQRPHFAVRAWLERVAASALWVNPHPCRLPQWSDFARKDGLFHQGTAFDSRIQVLSVPALPIEPLPLGTRLNRLLMWRNAWRMIEKYASKEPFILGVGRPSALALAALRELRPAGSFFDAMDNFPEFYGGLSRRAMRRCEDAVAAEVDCITASSAFLAEKFTSRGLKVEKVPNACEKREGGRRKAETKKSDLRLGYIGCIGRWFDWPLVIRLAESLPEAEIELIGPCVVPPPRTPPPNVRMLPACRQSEAAGFIETFSAGLIPFVRNALTDGVDPIKYYEYRAAGLPALSTRFGEMALRGPGDGVYFLDAGEPAEAVAAASRHRCEAVETARFQQDNCWTVRFRGCRCFESLWPVSRIRRAA